MSITQKMYDLVTSNSLLIAEFDYETSTSGDLSFKKNEIFKCLKTYPFWFRVKNISTNKEGFVPREYLVPQSSNKKENFQWFQSVSRIEAEVLLEDNPAGTFLVRPTDLKHAYSLSIQCNSSVGHYKIFKKRGQYFLSKEVRYKSLVDLINFYLNNASLGLVQHLIHPCPKSKPKIYDLCGKYRKNYEIDRDEVTILEELSSGCFGVVRRGRWRNLEIAIKELLHFDLKIFLKEVEPLKFLRHENVITLYGVCTKEDPYLMLFQYAENGSLENYLKKVKFITNSKQVQFIQQISSGMDYVSKKNIIHRDLAARNILITQHYKAVIADFGHSRITTDGVYEASRRETAYRWQALECFNNQFSIKSDVWSFGVVVVEIFTKCKTLYPLLLNPTAVLRYLEEGKRLEKPDEMPVEIYSIIKTCWNHNPNDRPNFHELKQFFYEYIL